MAALRQRLRRILGGGAAEAPRRWQGRFASFDEALRASGLRHYRDLAVEPGYIATRLTPPPPARELDLKHLGMLAGMLHCVASSGGAPLGVLDFGGGLGLHHRRLAPHLPEGAIGAWSVVELPAVAAAGTASSPDGPVTYFGSLDAFAAAPGEADVCLASGVLQALDDPFGTLAAIARLARRVLLISLPLTDEEEDFVAVGEREEPYPLWFFSRARFQLRCADLGLRPLIEWRNPETSWLVNGTRTPPAGNMLLERE